MQHFTDGIVWNNIVGIGLWSLLLARSFLESWIMVWPRWRRDYY